MILLFTILFILYYVSGVALCIYHWTKDYDFTTDEVTGALAFGFAGPFTHFLMQEDDSFFDEEKPSKIIIKQRD